MDINVKLTQCEFSFLPVLVILIEELMGGPLGNDSKWMQKISIKTKFIILFLYVLLIHSQLIAFKWNLNFKSTPCLDFSQLLHIIWKQIK